MWRDAAVEPAYAVTMPAGRLSVVAAEVAKSLVRVESGERSAAISLPMLLPGGTPVSVFIEPRGSSWLVHDNGLGALDAELMGGLPVYQRIARDVASRQELGFDERMFFVAEVSEAWLANMVVIIGDAVRTAVMRTAERIAEISHANHKEMLKSALTRNFRNAQTAFEAQITGNSSSRYTVDALVQRGDRLIAFDLVTPTPISVASVYTKFSDMADRNDSPGRVAVLTNRNAMKSGTLVLIGKAASSIIGVEDEDSSWRLLAA